ncbi:YycH family regulatory protein [Aquibacillus sediminis]|uniref:YycH family regulatory protein n=1 Tax=Aquibacillus sediminis TaxID=2574734 RepID=UPI0011093296|nr:two-component system activity regulator YycH [Aquibacillus sediminis]
MKLETIKSSVLVFLILLSLLLTLRIWNYQPQYEEVDSDQSTIEAKLDGKEETKKSIIQPSQIIFHDSHELKGFKDKSEEKNLYNNMQDWLLYGFDRIQADSTQFFENQHQLVEVIFPTLIPMEILPDLFAVDSDTVIPSTSFDRISIMLDEEHDSNPIYFVNTENKLMVSANIQNISEIREQLININEDNKFIPYVEYVTTEDKSIYLPNEIEMYERPFQANASSATLLRNALFDNPSAVRNSKNAAGANIFTDGIRTMVEYDYHIEYTNPIFSDQSNIEGRQLINETLDFINAHEGWTTGVRDDYQLAELDTQDNSVLYRLNYDGYPVIEDSNYSTIDITLRNQKVNQYNRPLIHLKSSFAGQKVDMRTGEEVVDFLNSSDYFSDRLIEDITLGYKMEEQQGYIIDLTPAWFFKSYLGWREIDFEQDSSKGGDV